MFGFANKLLSTIFLISLIAFVVLVLSVVTFDYKSGNYVCRSKKHIELGRPATLLSINDFNIKVKPINYTCPTHDRINRDQLGGFVNSDIDR